METLDKWKHLPYYNMRVFTLDCPCPGFDAKQTEIIFKIIWRCTDWLTSNLQRKEY